MPDRALPNVGLKGFWNLSEDGWKDDMDRNLLLMSVLAQGGAISKVSADPGSPANGDVYIFSETHPTHANAIAIRDDGAWVYATPQKGWLVYNRAAEYFEKFSGTAWAQLVTAASLDTDTTLAANSDLVAPSQKAIKTYVDSKLDGRAWKQPVRFKTTANVNLAGGGLAAGTTHDGVTAATGDRVLVASQTTASENGIYIVPASGAASRSSDADSGAEMLNATMMVQEGSANQDKQFTCSTNATITIGTTSLAFTQIGAGGGATNLDGLTDVDTTTVAPTNGQVLKYNSTSGLWEPGNDATGGSALTVKDEGTNLDTAVTSIDFVGAGVSSTSSGHAVTVTISGGGGGGGGGLYAAAIAARPKPTIAGLTALGGVSWGGTAVDGTDCLYGANWKIPFGSYNQMEALMLNPCSVGFEDSTASTNAKRVIQFDTIGGGGAFRWIVGRINSGGGYNSDAYAYKNSFFYGMPLPVWLRVRRVGTQMYFAMSYTGGDTWDEFYNEGTSFMTATHFFLSGPCFACKFS